VRVYFSTHRSDYSDKINNRMTFQKLAVLLVTLLAVSSLLVPPSNAEQGNDGYGRIGRETTYGDTTREQILETRERRKRQFRNMILDARRKLADHSAGEITLTADKKKQLEDQVDIFQRKLDIMQVDLQDWVRRTL
jgi:hypothetical protein